VAKHLTYALITLLGLFAGLALPALSADSGVADSPSRQAGKSTDDKQAEREYYELFSLLVDTIDQVERNYVKKLSRRELVEAAIEGVLHKLDPYSNYIAPEDITRFRTSVENQFGGIGIQVTMEGGVLTILSPVVGSPAYREGLEAGDRILEIEGEPTLGKTIDDAVNKLKGEVGSQVKLTILSPKNTEPRQVTLTREMIHLETVLGDVRADDDRWNFVIDPANKIGYIRLTGFGRDTAAELRQTLGQLTHQGLRGLILDLRFNPGGLLTSAIEVSDLFVSEGVIVSTEGRNVEPRVWTARAEDTLGDFPLAVLVNRYSASSSEIVAACLQDHKRAVIVGERTWGKGSVQNVVELEGGRSALKLTTASYKRPSGKNIHRFPGASEKEEWGVVPDEGFVVKLNDDELRRLVEYRRARDIVRRKTAKKPDQLAVHVENPPAAEEGKPAENPGNDPATDSSAVTPTDESQTPPASPSEQKQPSESDSAAAESHGEPPPFADRQLQTALDYVKKQLENLPPR
jgi:carboxyl-terminal processing protease